MLKNKMFLVFLLFSLLLIVACGEEETLKNSGEVAKVKVEKISSSDVPALVEYSGNVEGLQRVKLSTKLMGTITSLPFEAGAKIRRGQVLARINSADMHAKKQQVEAGIAQAEAALTNMQINYDRVKSLYKKKSATQKEMDDMQMAYDMTVAQVNQAKAAKAEINDVLGYSVIKAPFDGFIVNKFFEQGDISAPGHPIMIVENFDQFKVTASVSAADINRFNSGDLVKVVLDEIKKSFEGKIIEVNPGAHPASRQYDIKIEIKKNSENSDLIKSGMYAKVVLEDKSQSTITINKEYLVKRGQLKGVFTVSNNNEALLRWLRLGKEVDGKYEVLSGLSLSDVVIVNPENVKEGQRLEVL